MNKIYLIVQDEKGKIEEIAKIIWILWSDEKKKKYIVLDVKVEE